ncbi:hypothetical protein VRK_23080 [Vibrio sp. MEBiC08052]|nr:hypothetical protein VRK_23080 [Vibrio sp. MEBiC08052]
MIDEVMLFDGIAQASRCASLRLVRVESNLKVLVADNA